MSWRESKAVHWEVIEAFDQSLSWDCVIPTRILARSNSHDDVVSIVMQILAVNEVSLIMGIDTSYYAFAFAHVPTGHTVFVELGA
jgi:hypothetical protein